MQRDANGILVTWEHFFKDMKDFLLRLMERPLEAQPSPYLRLIGMDKKKIINNLLKNGVLERIEGISDADQPNGVLPVYTVKYIVKGRNFERKLHRMFSKYYEKNVPEPKPINEEGEGGCAAGSSSAGSVGGSYEAPLSKVPIRRVLFNEDQIRYIQEATGMSNIGDVGDYTANGLVLKTSDGKRDPSYKR